jgi:hypothetical protein
MIEKILIGEVEKESVNNVFSDVLFLGKDKIFQDTISELSAYSNHFEELSLKKITLSNQDDFHHVIAMCFKKGIIPVVFVNDFEQTSILSKPFENKFYLSNQMNDQNNTMSHVGFQRHLSQLEDIQTNFDANSYSLGKLNADINALEPALREAELIMVDLNVLSSAVLPLKDNKITGLYPDVLIQLIKFASHSPNLKALFFKTGNIEENLSKNATEIIATAIWYFLEGLLQGQHKPSPNDEKFFVSVSETEEPILFIHSLKYNKWWFQLEAEGKMYACTYSEYDLTVNGDLPDRILDKIIGEN